MDLEPTIAALAPRLLRYCTGLAGDPGLGEDAAQEALAALVRRWQRHGAPDSPEAFAFRVAQRRARRASLRRRLWRPLTEIAGRDNGQPGPAERALDRGRVEAVRRALARLQRHDREALLLVGVGEVSSRAAAELLGISTSALKMRVHRARGRLREMLEADDAT